MYGTYVVDGGGIDCCQEVTDQWLPDASYVVVHTTYYSSRSDDVCIHYPPPSSFFFFAGSYLITQSY